MTADENTNGAPPTYRVKDWNANYEKAQGRKLKNPMNWVAIPTKHDGKSYGRLMARENAAVLFSAWVLILQVAAKMPVRGILADEDGSLTADDLAMMTRFPAPAFETAFAELTKPDIGWLEVMDGPVGEQWESSGSAVGEDSQSAPTTVAPQDRTGQDETEHERRGEERTEQDETEHDTDDSDSPQSIPPPSSDSDSARQRGNVAFQAAVCPLIGRCGDARHPPGTKQADADRTCARQWWDERIWPADIDPAEGKRRLDIFTDLTEQAVTKRKPMAWLTKRLAQEFGPPGGLAGMRNFGKWA